MNTKLRARILALCECSILIALATVLSFIKLWDMPIGGSVTLVSMLPIFLIALRHNAAWAYGSAFLYSLIQLAQALLEGNVFVYCEGWFIVLLCVVFDYLFPFTALAVAGLGKNLRLYHVRMGEAREIRDFGIYIGVSLAMLLRFVGHFITGWAIWGQWAPEGMGAPLYSLVYNAPYLGVELILTLIVLRLILAVPQMRRLLGLRTLQVSLA